MNARTRTPRPLEKVSPALRAEIEAGQVAAAAPTPPTRRAARIDPADTFGHPHFRCLGAIENTVFVQRAKVADILAISIPALRPLQLGGFAPVQWWEMEFPGKGGADWTAAANAVVGACLRAGRFDPENVVGPGVHLSGDTVVAHLGDHLVIDGQEIDLGDVPPGGKVFKAGAAVNIPAMLPLTAREGGQLVGVCRSFDWQAPGMGELLAGWLVVAPLSGILLWRPHIWVTGPSKAGKSTVMDELVALMLKGVSAVFSGSATEAGIRQTLDGAMWPVVVDEAEAKDDLSAPRIARILELTRASASKTGAGIAKGGAGGKQARYPVKSCFALASITPPIKQTADETRFIRLVLTGFREDSGEAKVAARAERFARIVTDLAEMRRTAYPARLFRRSLAMAPTILANIDALVEIITLRTGSGRLANVLAPCVAGWHALTSDETLTRQTAMDLVDRAGWIAAASQRGKVEEDHDALLRHLMESHLRMDGGHTRTIGELVQAIATGDAQSGTVEVLARHGFKLDLGGKHGSGRGLMICRGSGAVRRLCHGTQWSGDPFGVIRQHPHATTTGTESFAGVKARADRIDLDAAGLI